MTQTLEKAQVDDPQAVTGSPIRLEGEYIRRMSREEFLQFCHDNRELRIEREPDQTITVMSPASSKTGRVNNYLSAQLMNWAEETRLGEAFDSSTGFELPDKSTKSPDSSFIYAERWAEVVNKDDGFIKIVPDFVIELKSNSDTWAGLQRKMEAYMANGVRLGWLFYVEKELVLLCRPGQAPDAVQAYDRTLSGEDVLPGFSFDLAKLKAFAERYDKK